MDFFSIASNIAIPLGAAIATVVYAKKQIINTGVTQFRQKWIDDLREAISVFISKAEIISMLSFEEEDEEDYFEHFRELVQMQYKIEMMLNPNEDDHNAILRHLEAIRDWVHLDEIKDEKRFDQILEDNIKSLLKTAKIVLKREWTVVKKGR